MYLPSCGHAKARSVVKVVLANLMDALSRALARSANSGPLHEGRVRCANTKRPAVEDEAPAKGLRTSRSGSSYVT